MPSAIAAAANAKKVIPNGDSLDLIPTGMSPSGGEFDQRQPLRFRPRGDLKNPIEQRR